MTWPTIPAHRVQPAQGPIQRWKDIVATDCSHRCVYCSVRDAEFGGLANFEIDHFRPHSRSEFEHLREKIANLFLACSICNRLKSDEWLGEPCGQGSLPRLPDPAVSSLASHVHVDPMTHLARGTTRAGLYVAERMHLNRYQLVLVRRRRTLLAQAATAAPTITRLLNTAKSRSTTDRRLRLQLMSLLERIILSLTRVADGSSYLHRDLRDPAVVAARRTVRNRLTSGTRIRRR